MLYVSLAIFLFFTPIAWGTSSLPAERHKNAKNFLNKEEYRVRIPIKFIKFKAVRAQRVNGQSLESVLPDKADQFVLKSKMNTPNKFYMGDYHVDVIPTVWEKTDHYQTRLVIYRRFGEFGQNEEKVGDMLLSGVLKKQSPGVFLLEGLSQKVFRNRKDNPELQVYAGHTEPILAKDDTSEAHGEGQPKKKMISSKNQL